RWRRLLPLRPRRADVGRRAMAAGTRSRHDGPGIAVVEAGHGRAALDRHALALLLTRRQPLPAETALTHGPTPFRPPLRSHERRRYRRCRHGPHAAPAHVDGRPYRAGGALPRLPRQVVPLPVPTDAA